MKPISMMYYIVDGNGNYYRLNGKQQLVVAQSREDADVFSFREANQRIGAGKQAYFYSAIPAEAAECHDQQAEVTEEVQEKSSGEEKKEALRVDWLKSLTEIDSVIKCMGKYQERLNQALSEVDLEICDIMHYVELYDLSEQDSLHAVELLRTRRERRREVKDEMVKAEAFEQVFGSEDIQSKIRESIKQIRKLEHRKYVPRMMPELFADGKIREKTADSRCDERDDGKINDESYHMNTECLYEEMENEKMTKKTTLYDGRKNDWAAFVQGQVDFFANAKQYIWNLSVDVEAIDQEIDEIMYQIEDANYNVAQGYKVFKRLKELRNERKVKMKELTAVETVVSCFDCESMLEAYQYSLSVIEEETVASGFANEMETEAEAEVDFVQGEMENVVGLVG